MLVPVDGGIRPCVAIAEAELPQRWSGLNGTQLGTTQFDRLP